MTTSDEKLARHLLTIIAEVKELFRLQGIAVGRNSKVSKTVHAVEIVNYEDGPAIEGYLDAELKDGTAISWLLDATWTGEFWTIEARLARSTAEGQDTIQKLRSETTPDVAVFVDSIVRISRELLDLRPPSSELLL